MRQTLPSWRLSLSRPIQSDHLAIANYDDTAFRAGALTWQDPAHSWKAGPGEVMAVEKNFLTVYIQSNFKKINDFNATS